MADITRRSLLLREDLHMILTRAQHEWPAGVPGLRACFDGSVEVDNGIAAAVLMARSGASTEEVKAAQRFRDARRKRRDRLSA